jgi:UDP-N-acetylmuramoyl-L-alanyl-D-glutamate--2,6-diaminopimelate ligase
MRGAHDGIEVLDVAYDSRRATPGCLFVCIPGHAADGHDFAADAVRRGAVALVVTRELDLEVPQVLVEDARDALAVASVALFGDGSRRLDVVGVTGTAGKTTVTHMVEHVVRERGGHAGVIGTVGYRYGSHEMPPTFTTPVSRELQELLGSSAVAVEVEEILLDKVGDVRIDVLLFFAVQFNVFRLDDKVIGRI